MISVRKLSKNQPPNLPLRALTRIILGQDYDLSLVWCGDKLSQDLNRRYRAKNRPTNVLSFPLTTGCGEIFINLKLARAEARKNTSSYRRRVGELFIHGLLHLKGMDHGSKMDREEKQLSKLLE